MSEPITAGPLSLLTVIVLTGSDPDRAQETLRSLAEQTIADRMEVLLLTQGRRVESPPGVPRPPFQFHCQVWTHGSSFGDVRARAVHSCESPFIAFLEDHCLADPLWAETMVRAFEDDWAAVGGEPHNGNPGIGISDAVELMNFSQWLPPAKRGQDDMIVGHNGAYRREVLLGYGPGLAQLLRSDSVLHMKLHADGHKLLVEPSARFSHANENTLASICYGYFKLNQAISATRAEIFEWSTARRLTRAALWPLVPLRRTALLFLHLARNHPRRLGKAVSLVPVMMVAWTAAGLGQTIGCLFGNGSADQDFLRFEAESMRKLAPGGIRPPRPFRLPGEQELSDRAASP